MRLHPANTTKRWEDLYSQVSLLDVPRHFADIQRAPFLVEYLKAVLQLCPPGGRSCEIGVGSGYGATWLSLRGARAEGIDNAPAIVERARQVNNIMEGQAAFRLSDMFRFYEEGAPRYHVIHHQGVLEHFAVPWIRAALAQQVTLADHVVLSVPSIHYPFEPEFGNERLLDLDEWKRILEPFDVAELKYYGDPQIDGREHILAVLRGQPVDEVLRSLMTVAEDPYPQGISAIVHTRNEARHIADCLRSLQGWTDEIIVCDMESEDATVEIARGFADQILSHLPIANFDQARNASAMRASYRWVFYLDADERVPPALGQALRQLTQEPEPRFEALLPPFRHHFAGHWMRSLYPGYTTPRLFKNGRFHFSPRLHGGAQVEGRTICFPANDPGLALTHYSFDSLSHYLSKLNLYTDGEAIAMHRDGGTFHWQDAVRHFVREFQFYYDQGRGAQDGVHGFLYAFHSAFYRFEQHAKLFELRHSHNQLQTDEAAAPLGVEQVLEYALHVLRQPSLPQASAIKLLADPAKERERTAADPGVKPEQAQVSLAERVDEGPSEDEGSIHSSNILGEISISSTPADPVRTHEVVQPVEVASLVWSGPLYDPSGYGEESRHFVFGLEEEGAAPAVQPLPWSHSEVDLSGGERAVLQEMAGRLVAPGFTHITQNAPPAFKRHPQAGVSIGRIMFETDRLPADWVQPCNLMDYIWVPSEFNRQTFAAAGVDERKLVVIPGCLDLTDFAESQAEETLPATVASLLDPSRFTFLSVFDWTRHKGWDVLLRAFVKEFEGRDDVTLIFKVWSTLGYAPERIREMAVDFTRRELGHDLLADGRIRFAFDRLTRAQLRALYRSCDAFVLPSRGEGWGRPYMEAMACGKPTIGTRWSGNTAFMNQANSYLIGCQVVPVPEVGWREIPTYKGHCWAEPDASHLRQLMGRVLEERDEAATVGQAGREHILAHCDRRVVGRLIRQELERVHQKQGAPGTAGRTSGPMQGGPQVLDARHQRSNGSPVAPETPSVGASELELHGKRDYVESAEPVRVRWEGAFFEWHSLAHVNREMCLGLSHENVELSLVPVAPPGFDPQTDPRSQTLAALAFAPLPAPADVHVRHFFPPRLNRPAEGRFVLIQPWEYGFLPIDWIEPIRRNVDEVWCYSEYVRQVYRDSGIPEEKLRVVPLGVDPDVFHPRALRYIFTDEPGASRFLARGSSGVPDKGWADSAGGEAGEERPFVFLFTGGTLHRKGIDLLLEAYLKAFSSYDDVCLVIKDTGTQTVYRDQNQREHILSLVADETRPPIIYTDEELTAHQLAGLYTTVDCLVQPYRGEGFCLPALEAMACGRPVIVTGGGPTDDFVDESVGWRLPAAHKAFALDASGRGRIGEWECVGATWMLEVGVEDLVRAMRYAYHHRDEVRKRGEAAAARVHSRWTWKHSCAAAQQRLRELQRSDPTKPTSSPDAVQVAARLIEPVNPSQPRVMEATSTEASPEPPLQADGLAHREDYSVGVTRSARISLCMIVRDEERVLDACLRSIVPWVDEVIVVDTGSTDRTVEIAQRHGARVFHFPWCDDFSAARNESLRHATGDWILWMDADDTIPEACGRNLRDLAFLAEERMTGFLMQVHIPPAPGEHGFTVVDHVKLFRNRPELQFEGRIHEQILEAIHRYGGRVERSDLYVVHSGYDYSPEGQQKKRERDLRLLHKDLEERPDHPFVLFNIGMTAFHLEDYDEARPALERCLKLCKPRESIVRKVYAMLAGCHLSQGRLEQAQEIVERGLSFFPQDPELLFRAGVIYYHAGDWVRAEQSYIKLLTQRHQGHIDSLDITMMGFKAHHNLALTYVAMGRDTQAEEQFRAATADNMRFLPAWLGLVEMHIRRGQLQEARQLVAELAKIDAQNAAEIGRYIEST